MYPVGQPKLDLEKMMAQKLDAVKGLTSGIAYLFKNNKVLAIFVYTLIINVFEIGNTKGDTI